MIERRREQKEHGTREFPFQIYSAPDAKDSDLVPYHWHPEVEIITVLQGEVEVTIRDEHHSGRVLLSGAEPISSAPASKATIRRRDALISS